MNVTACAEDQVSAMGAAILEHLHDCNGECTLLEMEHFEAEFERDVWDEVTALVFARRAFVSVPLSRMDWDTTIMLITWKIGQSTRADIEREFGEPHKLEHAKEATVLRYDLYVENVGEGYPKPPASYGVRDSAYEGRPDGCNFPFAPIWPPEALQARFEFDAAGVLAGFEFEVAERLT
jgi:hypothetical protein